MRSFDSGAAGRLQRSPEHILPIALLCAGGVLCTISPLVMYKCSLQFANSCLVSRACEGTTSKTKQYRQYSNARSETDTGLLVYGWNGRLLNTEQ